LDGRSGAIFKTLTFPPLEDDPGKHKDSLDRQGMPGTRILPLCNTEIEKPKENGEGLGG
jgi:hypothetical protein